LLVEALKLESPQITNDDIKDRILKDFLQFWTRETIMDSLGNEYKDKVKQEAGQKGAIVANITKSNNQEANSCWNDSSKWAKENEKLPMTPNDFLHVSRKVETLTDQLDVANRTIEALKDRLSVKDEMIHSTDNAEVTELKERLESAEMEIKFLREGADGERFIQLKSEGKNNTSEFFYADRVGINLLKKHITEFEERGVKTFQIYMQVIMPHQ
jgi:hypothetical protein